MKAHQKKHLVCFSLIASFFAPCKVVLEVPVLVGIATAVTVTVATTPEAEAIWRYRYYRRTPRSYTKRSATDRPSGMEQLQKWQKEGEERDRKKKEDEEKELKKLAPLGIVYDLPSNTERVIHNEFTYFQQPGTNKYYYCYYYDGRPVFILADNDSSGKPAGRPPFPSLLLKR